MKRFFPHSLGLSGRGRGVIVFPVLDSSTSQPQFIDINDKSALVCVDNMEWQNVILTALTDLDFKIHTGVFHEDIINKIQSQNYNVVVIAENFLGETLEDNQILKVFQKMPMSQRRKQLIVLIGDSVSSADRMTGFLYSVNLTVFSGDLPQFQTLVKRALVEQEEFYQTYSAVLKEKV